MFLFYKNSECAMSNGIGIFNKILDMSFYAGIIINTAIVTFSNPYLWNSDIQYKFGFFFCFINFFLIVNYLVKLEKLPVWFDNSYLFEKEYKKKFLNRRK